MPSAVKPVVFTEVADVLATATAPGRSSELTGEAAAVASFRAAGLGGRGSSWTRAATWRGGRKAALATLAAIGLLGAGGAAAAAGGLPDAAQNVAHDALDKVGVEVPRGKGLATAPGQQKEKDKKAKEAKEAKVKDAARPESTSTPAAGQGATISSLANDPTLTGADKGAAVSAEASDGKSKAGQPKSDKPKATPSGPPASTPVGPPASSPGATAPGRATASTAGPRGEAPTGPESKGGRP